ncbi:MAG: hypothetical protein L0332_27995 [Chloroflexi bacterium]|nr:hypothetical protein [Chloroflexota bacterium]MCI0574631.1 hypothetical protein [Chloroflexota bacterium]MCI0645916.1 hypothetical protein [Chloroflexota bacterium]MCI0730542.1 hypothetical protein [Chloroflexota bacterium]
MGIFRRLFGGGGTTPANQGDNEGFFVYVQCNNCGDKVRLRIHKQHDLNLAEGGYVWHKTIVDNRCFRPIPTEAHFDSHYQMTQAEIEGGQYITQAEYEGA